MAANGSKLAYGGEEMCGGAWSASYTGRLNPVRVCVCVCGGGVHQVPIAQEAGWAQSQSRQFGEQKNVFPLGLETELANCQETCRVRCGTTKSGRSQCGTVVTQSVSSACCQNIWCSAAAGDKPFVCSTVPNAVSLFVPA